MSNGVPDDRPSDKKENFTTDEVYHLIAELKVSIDGYKASLDIAIERSVISDRNFDGRLKAVEGTIEATQSKAHEDAQKLTRAIDRCYIAAERLEKARESTEAARYELRETTQQMQRIIAILEKINVERRSPPTTSGHS